MSRTLGHLANLLPLKEAVSQNSGSLKQLKYFCSSLYIMGILD